MRVIQVIRAGNIIREYPCDHYTLNMVSSCVAINDKETRQVVCVLSPNVFDFVEVTDNGS